MELSARDIIAKAYKNQRNFMTPNIIRFGRSGEMAYELAWGEGVIGGKIYGVSVVHCEPQTAKLTKERGLSDCYHSLKAAEEAIKKIPKYRNHNSRGE